VKVTAFCNKLKSHRLTPAPATAVAGKPMSDHNFWTEWARTSPRVSLDA